MKARRFPRTNLAQLEWRCTGDFVGRTNPSQFLGRLCGIATLTAEYVALISGTAARLYDTRKTTPGWRRLEKFAVRCGGGRNHRLGLHDAILIKDNHLAMVEKLGRCRGECCGVGCSQSARLVRQNSAQLPAGMGTIIQIEVDRLSQFEQAPAGPTIIFARQYVARLDAPGGSTSAIRRAENRVGGLRWDYSGNDYCGCRNRD